MCQCLLSSTLNLYLQDLVTLLCVVFSQMSHVNEEVQRALIEELVPICLASVKADLKR